MAIGDYARRELATIESIATIQAAATQMAEQKVGSLLVYEKIRFVGIVTDRDVALRTIREKLDPTQTPIKAITETEVVVINEKCPVRVAIRMMKRYGLRRMLIGDKKGEVLGIVSWDDLVGLVARELAEAAGTIAAQAPHLPIPASRAVIELAYQGEPS
jgi:CBS domain-containing protein